MRAEWEDLKVEAKHDRCGIDMRINFKNGGGAELRRKR